MSVRNLAAAGLAVYVLGGPLVLLDLPAAALGTMGRVGLVGVWLGVGLLLTALLAVSRTQHRMLRTQAERIRGLGAGASKGRDPDAAGSAAADAALPAALRDELARLERYLDERLDSHQRGLLQVIDARILGIHETVRDLTASEPDGPA